jgi:hypothetical protein
MAAFVIEQAALASPPRSSASSRLARIMVPGLIPEMPELITTAIVTATAMLLTACAA